MINSIEFQVSAKTARLIGRENISDADGAILELVKNGYDADAECVFIKYINPYNNIPEKITLSDLKEKWGDAANLVENYYVIESGQYTIKKDLTSEKINELEKIVMSLSKIIIIDNGCGMTQEILKTSWMNIGTNDKEVNIYSKKKKRVKTGAKGIGRFALDKLSLQTKVITKNINDDIIEWSINWSQFDNVNLLSQVKAKLEIIDGKFSPIVENLLQVDYSSVKDYNWATGTAIILTPIREFWNQKLYLKVNNSLQNLNPLGSVDKFDVIVKNEQYPSLDCINESQGIDRESYDYKINAEFDGSDKVILILDRNEINTKLKSIIIEYTETDKEEYDLNEFWNSEVFKKDKYNRSDFNSTVKFEYSLKEILPKLKEEDIKKFSSIGKFSMTVFYLKSVKMGNSVELIRDFKSGKRKKLLNVFSGVKIYRDSFKVRPYGDEGAFKDWIKLSERMLKSPAAASHEKGNWRVAPNQVIGSVSISRLENIKLEDTANREGMNLNEEYYSFIRLIQGIFEKFESDRQYPLREYAIWLRQKTKAHTDKVQEIYEQVMRQRESQKINMDYEDKTDDNEENTDDNEERSNEEYTAEDYKDVIYSIGKQRQNEMTTQQLLMLLSSAGVMAQTFSHEISRIDSDLGSRGQHLRVAVNRILDNQPYNGDEDFNPYIIINELDQTDKLLADWVTLIMDSVQKDNFYSQEVKMSIFLQSLKNKWMPLLDKKYINMDIECSNDILEAFPLVDLHLLLNNFILNSAYFLEEKDGDRNILIKVYYDDDNLYLDMKNNGPSLDEKYKQNPNEIFNATISSKEKGTGLGLWIAREAVIRNYGNIRTIPIEDGFMLRASWKK